MPASKALTAVSSELLLRMCCAARRLFRARRYWPARGPQSSLYVPAALLKEGANELLILELHPPAYMAKASASFATGGKGRCTGTVSFSDKRGWGSW